MENNNLNAVKIVGGRKLFGEVSVDGAKNAVLSLMVASSLGNSGVTILNNVPNILDIKVTLKILKEIGITGYFDEGKLYIENNGIKNGVISESLSKKVRHSLLFLGPLVAVLGEAQMYYPGGDNLGERPIDVHIKFLERLGVDVTVENNVISAKARELPLKGDTLDIYKTSVGGTTHAILTAVACKGTTIIKNADIEPEIRNVIELLIKMGANISGVGTNELVIEGGKELQGTTHDVIPDRLEAGTLISAAAMTRGNITLRNFEYENNQSLLNLIQKIGIEVVNSGIDFIEVNCRKLNSFNISFKPFPGISTDLQPLLTSVATQCEGISLLNDTVFKNRFSHISELQKLGASINTLDNLIKVSGCTSLVGGNVAGKDIRATTSLLCAGLAASGETVVNGTYHLHRGHGSLVEKLNSLGGNLKYESLELV